MRARSIGGAALALAMSLPLWGQELEPGAYSVSPTGVNFLVVNNSLSGGDVTFDPTLPIENATANVNTTAVSYVRTFGFFGRSANFALVVPYTVGHVEGDYIGEFTEVDRSGWSDPRLRFSFILRGAPAMSLKEFASYRQKTNIGVSLLMVAPLGEYDPGKLVNLGSNRWSFKPELALSRAFARWTLELYGGVWLFTDNQDFYGGRIREQDPLASFQVHTLYTFKPRLWAAFDINFYRGGRTTVDGLPNLDFQTNSRAGVTLSVPIHRRQSLKFAFSRGAYTTIGADFDSFAVAYQYLWGAGL